VKLAPVHVVADADAGIEVTLVNGDRVRVSGHVSAELIGDIVRALRRPC
jgi:hypothetical protein